LVVVPFPLSSQPVSKRRPALVLASWAFGSATDYLLCMITTRQNPGQLAILLDANDLVEGQLAQPSLIRPQYPFAVSENLIVRKMGRLQLYKLEEVKQVLKQLLP
jgi:hypothetical protein